MTASSVSVSNMNETIKVMPKELVAAGSPSKIELTQPLTPKKNELSPETLAFVNGAIGALNTIGGAKFLQDLNINIPKLDTVNNAQLASAAQGFANGVNAKSGPATTAKPQSLS